MLRDLLQPIKETALRLRQLIANVTKGQQGSSESLTRHRALQQDEKSDQVTKFLFYIVLYMLFNLSRHINCIFYLFLISNI